MLRGRSRLQGPSKPHPTINGSTHLGFDIEMAPWAALQHPLHGRRLLPAAGSAQHGAGAGGACRRQHVWAGEADRCGPGLGAEGKCSAIEAAGPSLYCLNAPGLRGARGKLPSLFRLWGGCRAVRARMWPGQYA